MGEIDIRRWSMAAERRIADAVREIEALRREIRGKRRGTGVTYPNFNRVGKVYGGSVAAGTESAPTAGELKFVRVDTDVPNYSDLDDTPTTFYNVGPALDEDDVVIANLDIWGKYSDGSKAVWLVGGSEAGADVPSIKVGMDTDAAAENSFSTTSTTYDITWSDSETVNTDTSVFEQVESDPGLYKRIRCKVAGTYRVWYHIYFNAVTSHTASEVQRGSSFIAKTASDGSGTVVVPSSFDVVESTHIDSDDMPPGLGAINAKGKGESLYEMAANECFKVQFTFSSGTRGVKCSGESFGAQLVKRG